MLSPKPSTVSTKPRSSIGADHGGHSRLSSSRRWSGWTGSTIAGCWSPSASSRQPKPRTLLRHAERHSHGRVTQRKWPPANPERFNPANSFDLEKVRAPDPWTFHDLRRTL